MVERCNECPNAKHCELVDIAFGSDLCNSKRSQLTHISWDDFFMSMAYLTSMKSKDPRTKVGAVIVSKDNTILSLGYNGLPRNIEYHTPRITKPLKQHYVEHAERNAIYNSIRNHSTISNSIMYITSIPCPACTRAIIQTGITKVVIDSQPHRTLSSLIELQYKISQEMLQENNIEIIHWNGEIIRTIRKTHDGMEE